MLLALTAAGCGKQAEEQEKLPIRIATTLTRATDTAYEPGDAVGLYVVNRNGSGVPAPASSGNHADNARFTFDGSTWTPATQLYWKDAETHADFYCYYPYQSPISDVSAIPVAVRTDQRGSGYKESEVLWGTAADVAPTGEPVSILTRHALSNLIVVVKPGNGYTETTLAADIESLTLHSLRVHGTMDLATGQVTASGDAADMIPSGSDGTYRAMVIPQKLEDATLLSLKVDGYTYSMKQSLTFVANRQHTCTVTVNRTSEGINIGIGAWEEDETDYGGILN